MTTLNFKSDASTRGGNFEPLPIGRYQVKVSKAEVKVATTGTEQIHITFDVINNDSFKNRKLFHQFTFSAKAAPFLHSFLKIANPELSEEDNVTPEKVASRIIGCVCEVYADHEAMKDKTGEYTGKLRNKLSDWKAIEGATVPTITTTSPQGGGSALFS